MEDSVPRHETALLKRLKGSAQRWDRLYGNRKHLLNFNVCVAVCLHVMAAQKSGNRRWNKQTVMAANNSLLSDAQLFSAAVFGANLDSFSGIPQKALKLIIIKSCCPPELCSRPLDDTVKFIFNQKINILNILQSTAKLRGKEFLLNNVKWHLLEVFTWFQLRQSLRGNSG